MRTNLGWIHREPAHGAMPPRIKVTLRFENNEHTRVFDDSSTGAQAAADFISKEIGDAWKLEDLAFLGYRIITE